MKHTIDRSGTSSDIHAKDIAVKLSQTSQGKVQYDGSENGVLDAHSDELNLIARGQNGVNGIVADQGFTGSNGADGHHACQYFPGGNGSPGGKGGHGGRGTDGTDSGNGGNITVTLENADRALLDLIGQANVSAGIPGSAGRHGEGGAGGRGGRGGNSYTWTTETVTEVPESHKDENGDTHVQLVRQVQTHYHTNPGGYDGCDGPKGDMFTYPLYPGHSGKHGQYQVVLTENGKPLSSHGSHYRLSLKHTEFDSGFGSDIYEPGDHIRAYYAATNQALSMTSPPEDIAITLDRSPYIGNVMHGVIEGDIDAGSSKNSAKHPVQFQLLQPANTKRYEPYTVQVSIHAKANNTRLNKPYPQAISSASFTMQYPVRFLEHSANLTIARDEHALIPGQLHNISSKPLGFNGGKALSIDLQDENGNAVAAYEIGFVDGKAIDRSFSYDFQFDEKAVIGASKKFERNLYLQALGGGCKKLCIETQVVNVQLTPRYQIPSSGFTLVINAETSADIIAHWTKHLSILAGNVDIAVWNRSYYNDLPLAQRLLPEVGKGSVIVLDNVFQKDQRQKKERTSDGLNYVPLSTYASVMFVGSKLMSNKFKKQMQMFATKQTAMLHDSMDAMIQHLLLEDQNCYSAPEHMMMESRQLKHHVAFKSKYYFSKTPPKEEAEKLQVLLKKTFPLRKYKVCVDAAETQGDDIVLIVERLGSTLHQMHSDVFYSDDKFGKNASDLDFPSQQVVDGLTFAHALACFQNAGDNSFDEQLSQKLIDNLLSEQALLQKKSSISHWFFRLFAKDRFNYQNEMQYLNQWINALSLDLGRDQKLAPLKVALIINLCAIIQYQAQKRISFWDRFLNFFIAQPNISISELTKARCLEGLQSYAKNLDSSYESLKSSYDDQYKKVVLIDRLQDFIKVKTTTSPWTICGLFPPTHSYQAQIKAATAMINVLSDRAEASSLAGHQAVLDSSDLKGYFAEFKRLNCHAANFEDHVIITTAYAIN